MFTDTAWSLTGRILTNGVYLIFISFMVKWLGTARYGEFSIFIMVAQFYYTVFLVWLQNGIIRLGREEFLRHSRINELFSSHLTIALPIIILQVASLFIFRDLILSYFKFAPAYLYVLLAYMLCNYVTELAYYVLQALERSS